MKPLPCPIFGKWYTLRGQPGAYEIVDPQSGTVIGRACTRFMALTVAAAALRSAR